MSSFKLRGKVAIVTGGASGIGLATAQAFLDSDVEGLTLVDISNEALQRAFATLEPSLQAKVLLVAADVSSESATENYVSKTIEKFGKLDISVQNAGITQAVTKLEETDMDVFDRVMRINVRGPFLGMKHSIKAMLASPGGGKDCAIVLTSSQLGLDGAPGLGAYASSKFAVRGMMLSAAAELGKSGIRINAIAPGPINTPMMLETPVDRVPVIAGMTMLGRLGAAEEIANGILYLASDAARYVTGTTLKVDGGYSRWG